MTVPTSTYNEHLAGALRSLGVRFLLGGQEEYPGIPPARLIAALAQNTEARLRIALIPLFLERPDFAVHVRFATEQLDGSAQVTLMCYYTAAMLLQELHRSQIIEHLGIQVSLPDLFSKDLAIPEEGSPEERLDALASRHRILSGSTANWLGTYHHAVRTWLRGLEMAEHS